MTHPKEKFSTVTKTDANEENTVCETSEKKALVMQQMPLAKKLLFRKQLMRKNPYVLWMTEMKTCLT